MKQSLRILKNTFSYKIDETVYDYEISYDITGKVYHSKAQIFELPEAAQKLILGKNYKELKNKISAFEKLITVIIPLGIMNQGHVLKEELADIIHSINEELRNQGILLNKLYELADEGSVVYDILYSYSKRLNNKLYRSWNELIRLINILQQEPSRFPCENYVNYKDPKFGFEISQLVVPFLKTEVYNDQIYSMFQHYVHDDCALYLIQELQRCEDEKNLPGLFTSLSVQKHKDRKIQMTLLKLYGANFIRNEQIKISLMNLLESYPNKDTFEVLLEIVAEEDGYTSHHAFGKVKKMGVPEKEIFKVLLPKLDSENIRVVVNTLSKFSRPDEYYKYLPKKEALLEIYIKLSHHHYQPEWSGIAASFSKIFKDKMDAQIAKAIVSSMRIAKRSVQVSIIALIRNLVHDLDVDISLFNSPELKKKCLEWLNDSSADRLPAHVRVKTDTILILSKIGAKEADAAYIPLFLDWLDITRRPLEGFRIMKAINSMLPHVPYDPLITKKYLALLKIETATKMLAMDGLRFSDDIQIRRLVLQDKEAQKKSTEKQI